MGRHFSVSIAAAISALCVSCTEQPYDTRRTIVDTNENDCMFFSSVSDWRVLNARNLIITGNRNERYQVTLSVPVHDLDFADAISFVDSNHDNRLCGFGRDAILIPGSVPERVTITGMRRIEDVKLGIQPDENDMTVGEPAGEQDPDEQPK